MAIDPEPQDVADFIAADWEGPVTMVNLLKFADQADYGDADEAPCSGSEAYGRYGELATPFLTGTGAHVVYRGDVHHMLIGDDTEAWDEVLIVRYPSHQAFIDLISNPDYHKIAHHRTAALSRAVLLASKAE
jgi:uncharacterized protein (DUF1330 family)